MSDAYTTLKAQGGRVSARAGGRGATAGWVKCPLCAVGSQKRFARGKGFAAHLAAIHTDADAAEVVRMVEETQFADGAEAAGKTRTGGRAVTYTKSLSAGIQAARDNDVATLRRLVEEDGYDPWRDRDRNGATGFDWASGQGSVDAMRYLCSLSGAREAVESSVAGAVPGKKVRRRDGKTALHWAARNGRVESVDFLLGESGLFAGVDIGSGEGTTPLHMAAYGGHAGMVAKLVDEHGADLHRKNHWGCDCSHFSTMSAAGYAGGVCALLHERGVCFHTAQKEGHTPVHKAAQKGLVDVCAWLAQHVPVDKYGEAGAPDTGGNTPSAIADARGDSTLAEQLRTHGW